MRPADCGSVLSSSLFALALCVGCGGSQMSPQSEASSSEPVVTPAEAPKVAAEPSKVTPSDAAQEVVPESAAKPEAKAEPDPNATREVTYVVVPEGLKISVAGAKFTVSAAATQIASGWGVKVSVVASASDGKAHSLASPKAGPLAFAGSVQRKGKSEPEAFADERVGDGEEAVSGEAPTKFSRTWPLKGVRVLGIGDALDLQVALWGLGVDKDERRPVKQFCHVRMQVDKGKPRAIVEPPASASGR